EPLKTTVSEMLRHLYVGLNAFSSQKSLELKSN
ncbi:hypothetical protein Anas_10561, partial [Armadillidium nasatum]